MKFERVELKPRRILGVHAVVAMSDLMEFFPRAFNALATDMEEHGIEMAGPPVALYHGDVTDIVDVTAGFPVMQVTPRSESTIAMLPGGTAIETIHTGPYESLNHAHSELLAWLEKQQLIPADDMWEEYLVGPGDVPDPSKWQTRIVYPLN